MKHLLSLLLAAILCATASAQSIRTLGYNTTNGQVVAATNVTWTNSFGFSTNSVAAQVRTNLSLGWSALTNTNAATSLLGFATNGQVVANTGTNVLTFAAPIKLYANNVAVSFVVADEELTAGYDGNIGSLGFGVGKTWVKYGSNQTDWGQLVYLDGNGYSGLRANLGFNTNLNTLWTATNTSNARSAVGLGATWLTNTNVTNFRTAVGLGATNQVTFGGVFVGSGLSITNDQITGQGITIDFSGGTFSGDSLGNVRSSIGLGLPALTNTSNVTMMRALSGSTNTNHPYSGSISVTGTSNTNTLVFSNGILQSVQ